MILLALLPGAAAPALAPQPADVQPPKEAPSQPGVITPPTGPSAPAEPAAPAVAPVSIAPPAPDTAMAAYRLAEAWIRGGAVDETAGPAVAGASVTLRLAGKVVGRGTDAAGGPRSLARAVDEALKEARDRIPVANDALRETALREARGQLCITLELAGPLVPYSPQYYDQVDLEVQAGLEGVAARQGDRTAAMFPETMLSNNTVPGDALAAVISQATGDAQLAIRAAASGQPGKLAKDHNLTLYRFKVAQLAQTGPGLPPIFLFRGGRVVSQNDISVASLRELADGLAGHLIASQTIVNGSTALPGTALPVQGKYSPALAPPFDQALAALSLRRYAARVFPLGQAEAASRANDLADALMATMARAHTAERPPTPATAAVCWVVIGDVEETPDAANRAELRQFRDRCAQALDAAVADPGKVALTDQAIVAWAMTLRDRETSGSVDAADTFVRSVFRETPPAMLASQMPWLGWAELELTAARKDGQIKSAPALREMRDQIWKHQLTADDCGSDGPDLVGGIVFTTARNPLPTWQCIRPLIFTASMLGQPGLTENGEVAPELARLLSSLRFVRQLAADEAAGHMYQHPDQAMWGIRSSLWDQRQPPEATAMALLLACETMEALEARAAKK